MGGGLRHGYLRGGLESGGWADGYGAEWGRRVTLYLPGCWEHLCDLPAEYGSHGGVGVWAFFSSPTAVTLPCITGATQMISLPADQFVMVSNPYDRPATLSGADVVDTFNTATNSYSYTSAAGTVTLQAGQGAWVFSASGGTLTIAAT